MINRDKLEHILEYARQQRHIGQSCKVPPEDMVEIMERLLSAGNSPAQSDCYPAQNHASPEQNGDTPAQSQGWIPVSEQLPEMGEHQCYVLAADFKNHYWPNTPNTQVGVYGDWFDDGNPTWDDGDGEDLHLKEVTHWMPLPAAPQEVKGES